MPAYGTLMRTEALITPPLALQLPQLYTPGG
eukprot:SAG25_NODE_10541_length_330_cov_0.670996_2_plen_30_part_01